MESIEKNMLIADFMGVKKKEYKNKNGKITRTTYRIPEHQTMETEWGDAITKDVFEADELSYTTDWSWLMPVVDKVLDWSTVKRININRSGLSGVIHLDYFDPNLSLPLQNRHIAKVWDTDLKCKDQLTALTDCLVQFINYYNENFK